MDKQAEARVESTAVEATGRSREQILELLRQDLVEISEGKLAGHDIDPKGHLFDYGYLDSLTAVTFLARIEQRFGVVIEDLDLLDNLTTLDALSARLQQD